MPQLVLLKPHTHAGKPGAIGNRIEVDAATAEWLLAHAVAEIAASDQIPQKVPPESRTSEALQSHQPTHSNQRKEPKS